MLSPVSVSSATEKGSGSDAESTSSSPTATSTSPVVIALLMVSGDRSRTSPTTRITDSRGTLAAVAAESFSGEITSWVMP